jgi:hypothetical protein
LRFDFSVPASSRCLHLVAWTAVVLLTLAQAEAETPRKALFRRALENHSTAPNYVLITLVSEDGRSRREACIPAPFLLGAVQREHHFPDLSKALETALSAADFVFQFKDPGAAENVRPRYTEAMLAEARGQLKDLSRTQLLAGFKGGRGPLDPLYSRYRSEEYAARRDAIAHVLLERGLLPGHGDVAGFLTVQE